MLACDHTHQVVRPPASAKFKSIIFDPTLKQKACKTCVKVQYAVVWVLGGFSRREDGFVDIIINGCVFGTFFMGLYIHMLISGLDIIMIDVDVGSGQASICFVFILRNVKAVLLL